MNFFRAATRTSTLIRPLTNTRSSPMWARWLSDSLRTKLDQDIKSKPIVLFMKGTADEPMCGFSRAAVQIMQVQGVDFKDVQTFNVLADDDLRQGIKEYSEWPTIPQVYINGEFVGGCDILLNMHQSGDLEDLLVKEGLIPEELDEPKQ
ncbi:thioredoxin-like protein [Halteromyces radiatus]|uniref:thioredoxin-like protein n=1 Tax=Halteromyces radiatus TaxID=101107 RepID=UPI00222003A1|nr:thioredoxin-like protein [Halteromyces radiatus]KAI8077861.1 thioredoxin-like protein [Halteromyces radiatus]